MRKATPEEVQNIDDLRSAALRAQATLELELLRLKQECSAPSYSQLSVTGQWCDAQGKPLHPVQNGADLPEFDLVPRTKPEDNAVEL